jgi:hypothetical protein
MVRIYGLPRAYQTHAGLLAGGELGQPYTVARAREALRVPIVPPVGSVRARVRQQHLPRPAAKPSARWYLADHPTIWHRRNAL